MYQNRSKYSNMIFRGEKAALLLIFVVFIISMFSLSYGYWTEQLEVKGDATIRMRLLIQNDVDIPAAPEAPSPLTTEDPSLPATTDAEMNAAGGETDLPQETEENGVSELPQN